MMTRPSARHAYVSAEITTALATQIRTLRMQRGWTQRELARRLETTQNAVSRMEDPGYGRLTMQTLLQLSRVFDTGLQVQFVSLVKMLNDTFHPKAGAGEVAPFEEEAPNVAFVANGHGTAKAQATNIITVGFGGNLQLESLYARTPRVTATAGSALTPGRVHTLQGTVVLAEGPTE